MSVSVPGETLSGSANYGLMGWTVTLTEPGTGTLTNSSGYASAPRTGSVFLTGMALTAAGLGLGALMVILVALAGQRPGLRKAGAVVGILGFVVLLVAPLYVMTALPGAMSADSVSVIPGEDTGAFSFGFWGSQSFNFGGFASSVSYGGGWGWFLALVAGIMLLIGGILALRAPRPAAMAPAPPGWTQAPGPYPPAYPQPYPPQPYPPQGPPQSPPPP
jgi:hypothetical protein